MHIVLTNVYSDGNRGGAAITISLLDLLRQARPEARFTLIPVVQHSRDPDEMFRHTLAAHPDVDVVLPPLVGAGPLSGLRLAARMALNVGSRGRLGSSPASRAIGDADLVVGKGGQAIRGDGSIKGALSLWCSLYPLALAGVLAVRTGVHAGTVGPFTHFDPAWLVARAVLRRVDLVEPRGVSSAVALEEMGVSGRRVRQVPDVVLGWNAIAGERSPRGLPPRSPDLPPGRFVAVTVKAFTGYDDDLVLAFVEGLVRSLVTAGAVEALVVVLQGEGSGSHDDAMSQRLLRRIESDIPCTYVRDDHSPQVLMDVYSGSVAVIGCRVHSTIFGLVSGSLGVPIEGAGQDKAAEILAVLGADDLPIHLPSPGEDLDPALRAASHHLLALLGRREERLAELDGALAKVQRDVVGSVEALVGSGGATTEVGR